MGVSLGGILSGSVREVVFGLEDSLVSTVGVVSGVAIGTEDLKTILLVGLVMIAVQAVSQSVSGYLSSRAAKEVYEERFRQDEARILSELVSDSESLRDLLERKGFSKVEMTLSMKAVGRERRLWLEEVHRSEFRLSPAVSSWPLFSAFAMGACYLVGGLYVIAPYLFFSITLALPVSIIASVIGLFLVGYWKSMVANVKPVRSGIEMVAVALTSAFIGIIIGHFVSAYTK